LDVTQNTSLTYLGCGTDQLSDIDLSQNINLVSLAGLGNNLTALSSYSCVTALGSQNKPTEVDFKLQQLSSIVTE